MFNTKDPSKGIKLISKYAINSSDLLFKNSYLKSQIDLYSNFIDSLKSFFCMDSEELPLFKSNIIKTLKENNHTLSKANSKVQNEINKKRIIYTDISSKNDFNILTEMYDKLKEDNFILQNTIKEKDAYIMKLTDDLEKIKKYHFLIEDSKEIYHNYSRDVNMQHMGQLTKLQRELAKKSRNHNIEKNVTERLKTEAKTLRKKIQDYQSLKAETERDFDDVIAKSKTIDLYKEDKYIKENRNNKINIIDKSLLFEDFENETNKFNLDLSINSLGNLYLDNVENHKEITFWNKENNNNNNNNKQINIPKLNLKQIEFNNLKICTQENERIQKLNKENIDTQANNINLQIKQVKNEISKLISRNSNMRKTKHNFKIYYRKMRNYIKNQMLKRQNSIISDNKTERILFRK